MKHFFKKKVSENSPNSSLRPLKNNEQNAADLIDIYKEKKTFK